MNIEEINKRVKMIADIADSDNDAAFSMETNLHTDVLTTIANGVSNPTELAKAALKTKELNFDRHTA